MKSQSDELVKKLNEHSTWVLSLGKTGKLADFKSWDLDEADLEMANLPFAILHFASIRNANLSGVNFRQAELLNVSLKNANLSGADLEGANLSEADLSFSNCTGANFCDVNLEGANFEGANLVKANFTRSILRGANFKGADLTYAEIVDANIAGANFKGAKIEATTFEGANLDKANFEEYLPEAELKDPGISDPKRKETKSQRAGINTQKPEKTTLNRRLSVKTAKEDLFVDSKSVNPNMIDEAVVDLIRKVRSSIHIDQVKARCKQQPDIEKIAKVDFERGDIVTHNDQVAFKLDYRISYKLSLLLDRKGNLIMDFPESLERP